MDITFYIKSFWHDMKNRRAKIGVGKFSIPNFTSKIYSRKGSKDVNILGLSSCFYWWFSNENWTITWKITLFKLWEVSAMFKAFYRSFFVMREILETFLLHFLTMDFWGAAEVNEHAVDVLVSKQFFFHILPSIICFDTETSVKATPKNVQKQYFLPKTVRRLVCPPFALKVWRMLSRVMWPHLRTNFSNLSSK